MDVSARNPGGNDDGGNEKIGPADDMEGDEENLSTEDAQDNNQKKRSSDDREDDGDYSNLERLRKQKRLAMNRASARNRRKQKREMLETLGSQVDDLGRINQGLIDTNTTLTNRIKELELELSDARNTIKTLLAATGAAPTQTASTSNDLVASLATILPALTASVPPSSASPLLSAQVSPAILSQLSSVVAGGGLLPAPGSAPPTQQPGQAQPNAQGVQPQQAAPPVASSSSSSAAAAPAPPVEDLEASLTQLLSTLDHQTLQNLWATTSAAMGQGQQPQAPSLSTGGGQSQIHNSGGTGVNSIPAGLLSLLTPGTGASGWANQGEHNNNSNNQGNPNTGGGQKRSSIDP